MKIYLRPLETSRNYKETIIELLGSSPLYTCIRAAICILEARSGWQGSDHQQSNDGITRACAAASDNIMENIQSMPSQ